MEPSAQISAKPAKFEFIRFLAVIVFSSAVTFGVWKLDGFRQQANQTKTALRWARQISTQAETLSLTASEKGEADPLSWAARLLSQGTDSRIIFVSKFHSETFQNLGDGSLEDYSLDPNTGIFEYSKVLFPEDGMGIEVKLYTSRTGIFGAKTQLGHDSTVLAIFVIGFGLFSWLFAKKMNKTEVATLEAALAAAKTLATTLPPPVLPMPIHINDPLQPLVSEWVIDAKDSLIDLTVHIREMTRSAAKLSTSAVAAQTQVILACEKLQVASPSLPSKGNPNELTELATQAETIFKTLNPHAQELVRRLLAVSIKNAQIKEDLGEVSENCERACDSLKDVGELARAVSAEISQTTAAILGQSKLVSELKKQTG